MGWLNSMTFLWIQKLMQLFFFESAMAFCSLSKSYELFDGNASMNKLLSFHELSGGLGSTIIGK